MARSPCLAAVAPHGQRFAARFAPVRVNVACGSATSPDVALRHALTLAGALGADVGLLAPRHARADAWLARARSLAPSAAAVRVPEPSTEALVAETRGQRDLLVVGGVDDGLLRQAACPVFVVPPRARR